MSNETISVDQMNEVIARFMGIVPIPAGTKRLGDIKAPEESIALLRYHSSWDCLMPVVEKIEGIDKRRYGITIDPTSVIVTDYDKGDDGQIIWVHEYPDNGDTKILMTHDAVYQFIQWHNQQNKPHEQ